MTRNLIIFGNGIGRALDKDFFSLECAMSNVWDNSECLSDEAKSLIRACLPNGIETPTSEEHLQDIYDALSSCQILRSFETSRPNSSADFLTLAGKSFFNSVKTYTTLVAAYFHTYNSNLPDNFIDPLVKYIKETKTHVATLNYDKLLYKPFNAKGVFGQYHLCSLVDGLVNSGFDETRLNRIGNNKFGWYLHLHGSPLFRNDNGKIVKINSGWLEVENDFGACPLSDHLVLSHVKHKWLYIEQSYLLTTYWKYLEKAMEEAEKVIVFGYSGGDIHLNEVVRNYSEKYQKPVIVIKRFSEEKKDNDDEMWKSKFGSRTTLKLFDNILDFNDWNNL